MVRKLNESDNLIVMEFLKEEAEFNHYLISDIEEFGYDGGFQEVYGEFNNNKLNSILLKCFGFIMVYAKNEFDVKAMTKIIERFGNFYMLVGKEEVVSKFEETVLHLEAPQKNYYSILRSISPKFKVNNNIVVKRVTVEDVDRIVELRDKIKEFKGGSKNFKEMLLKDFETKTARGYYVEIDGNMISYAQTSIENSFSAMIVNVMTEEKYRGYGYASACLNILCKELLKEGKTLCLYYENLKAGKIYKEIGFEEVGTWSMYKKIKDK